MLNKKKEGARIIFEAGTAFLHWLKVLITIGIPLISNNGLPGSLLELYLAGITIK